MRICTGSQRPTPAREPTHPGPSAARSGPGRRAPASVRGRSRRSQSLATPRPELRPVRQLSASSYSSSRPSIAPFVSRCLAVFATIAVNGCYRHHPARRAVSDYWAVVSYRRRAADRVGPGADPKDRLNLRVDGRHISVSGSLLQPLTRRTNEILRLVRAAVFLATVITSSLITRTKWVGLEDSIFKIVGVLTLAQSNPVYVVYGIAIPALPFVIPISLIVGRQWKPLGADAAAGFVAVSAPSISGNGIAAPRLHFASCARASTLQRKENPAPGATGTSPSLTTRARRIRSRQSVKELALPAHGV